MKNSLIPMMPDVKEPVAVDHDFFFHFHDAFFDKYIFRNIWQMGNLALKWQVVTSAPKISVLKTQTKSILNSLSL